MFTMVSSSRPEIHIKLEPRCRNVTKQDCVTKWELNSQGRKVWAGNEECRDELQKIGLPGRRILSF